MLEMMFHALTNAGKHLIKLLIKNAPALTGIIFFFFLYIFRVVNNVNVIIYELLNSLLCMQNYKETHIKSRTHVSIMIVLCVAY